MVTKNLFEKNKKGWIKIVEAFIAVLLLMGVLLIAVGTDNVKKNDETIMQDIEKEILQEIAVNQTLRLEVLGQTGLPINSEQLGFSSVLEDFINETSSGKIECILSICLEEETCLGYTDIEEDIYVTQNLITANKTLYSPRTLKIFCYIL